MRAGVLAGMLALSIASSIASSAWGDPTTDECIEANTKAQSLRRAGKLRDAREQLLLCGSPSCPKMVKDDCAQRMDEVDRVMPTVVFQAKDAQGHDLSNVRVMIDGVLLTDKLVGVALQVDVGDHEVAFSADGYRPYTQHFIIVEGQKDRRENITLTSTAPVLVIPPPPPPIQPINTARPPPPPPPVIYTPPIDPAVVEARRSRRTTGILLTVFGGLSLGGTIAFAVLGGQQNATIQAGGFATASDISSADTAGVAYNVGMGITLAGGLVLLAIGLPLTLVSLGDGTPAKSARLDIGPRGLGFQW
jgi:hypothetical protein